MTQTHSKTFTCVQRRRRLLVLVVVLLAPLAVMLAVVGSAQNFRVRQVQFLQFVQILAGRGGLELDHGIAVFVREVSEPVAAGTSGGGVPIGTAAAAGG